MPTADVGLPKMRAYIDGKEINEIPELAEVCKMDNWLDGLMVWMKKNRPKSRIGLFLAGDSPKNPKILEVWIGGAPKSRAMEIGGIVRRLSVDGT